MGGRAERFVGMSCVLRDLQDRMGWAVPHRLSAKQNKQTQGAGCSSQPLSWLSSPQLRMQQPHLWADPEPSEPPEEPRGLLGRGGGSDCRGRLHPGHGLRRGRQHPPALQLLRALRPQTHGSEAQVGAGAALQPCPAQAGLGGYLEGGDRVGLKGWLALLQTSPRRWDGWI